MSIVENDGVVKLYKDDDIINDINIAICDIKTTGGKKIIVKKPYNSEVRWYSFLKRSDNDGVVKRVLFDHEFLESKSLLVCQQLTYRTFAKFTNYITFCKYYLDESKDQQCFYEVILGTQPQKPYFDIDIPISDADGLTIEDSELLIIQLINGIYKVNPKIKSSDIMIFTSHTTNIQGSDTYKKKSFHIVVDNWCVTDHEENKAFCELVINHIDPKLSKFIDNLVYKSIQQLRIYGSHKWWSNRNKILDTECKWKPMVDAESTDHLFMMVLSGSLVTNVSCCQILPTYNKNVKKVSYESDGSELTKEEIEMCIDICAKFGGMDGLHDPLFPYKFIETKGKLISLKRMRPTYCNICKRRHETENPYLIVIGRDIYFHCRRAAKEKRLYVGTLKLMELPRPLSSFNEGDILKPLNGVMKGDILKPSSGVMDGDILKPLSGVMDGDILKPLSGVMDGDILKPLSSFSEVSILKPLSSFKEEDIVKSLSGVTEKDILKPLSILNEKSDISKSSLSNIFMKNADIGKLIFDEKSISENKQLSILDEIKRAKEISENMAKNKFPEKKNHNKVDDFISKIIHQQYIQKITIAPRRKIKSI